MPAWSQGASLGWPWGFKVGHMGQSDSQMCPPAFPQCLPLLQSLWPSFLRRHDGEGPGVRNGGR